MSLEAEESRARGEAAASKVSEKLPLVDRGLLWGVGIAGGLVVAGLLAWAIEAAIPEVRRLITPHERCADAWALARTSHDSVTVTLKCGTPAPADSVAP